MRSDHVSRGKSEIIDEVFGSSQPKEEKRRRQHLAINPCLHWFINQPRKAQPTFCSEINKASVPAVGPAVCLRKAARYSGSFASYLGGFPYGRSLGRRGERLWRLWLAAVCDGGGGRDGLLRGGGARFDAVLSPPQRGDCSSPGRCPTRSEATSPSSSSSWRWSLTKSGRNSRSSICQKKVRAGLESLTPLLYAATLIRNQRNRLNGPKGRLGTVLPLNLAFPFIISDGQEFLFHGSCIWKLLYFSILALSG